MLVALIALCAAAAAGWLAGRRPPEGERRRGDRWRHLLLVLVGAALIGAGDRLASGGAGTVLAAAGYVLVIGFLLANRSRAGLVLVALGLTANLVVIVADSGMPVRGLAPGRTTDGHHGLAPGDRLTGLADTIRVSPAGETLSPGDLLAIAGGAVAVFCWLEPPARSRNRNRNRRRTAPARP